MSAPAFLSDFSVLPGPWTGIQAANPPWNSKPSPPVPPNPKSHTQYGDFTIDTISFPGIACARIDLPNDLIADNHRAQAIKSGIPIVEGVYVAHRYRWRFPSGPRPIAGNCILAEPGFQSLGPGGPTLAPRFRNGEIEIVVQSGRTVRPSPGVRAYEYNSNNGDGGCPHITAIPAGVVWDQWLDFILFVFRSRDPNVATIEGWWSNDLGASWTKSVDVKNVATLQHNPDGSFPAKVLDSVNGYRNASPGLPLSTFFISLCGRWESTDRSALTDAMAYGGGINPPPTADLDVAWAAWQESTLYAKWRAANPVEAAKLDAYRAGGSRPVLVSAVGRALAAETAAWLDTKRQG